MYKINLKVEVLASRSNNNRKNPNTWKNAHVTRSLAYLAYRTYLTYLAYLAPKIPNKMVETKESKQKIVKILVRVTLL